MCTKCHNLDLILHPALYQIHYQLYNVSAVLNYRKLSDRQTPVQRLFQDNLSKPAPERLNQSGILTKQEMMGWQWHQLDHMQIICTSLQTDNQARISLIFTGQILVLTPNQQYQSIEGKQAQRFTKIHILSQAVLTRGFMATTANVHVASLRSPDSCYSHADYPLCMWFMNTICDHGI